MFRIPPESSHQRDLCAENVLHASPIPVTKDQMNSTLFAAMHPFGELLGLLIVAILLFLGIGAMVIMRRVVLEVWRMLTESSDDRRLRIYNELTEQIAAEQARKQLLIAHRDRVVATSNEHIEAADKNVARLIAERDKYSQA
jgi:hypothetical protein